MMQVWKIKLQYTTTSAQVFIDVIFSPEQMAVMPSSLNAD